VFWREEKSKKDGLDVLAVGKVEHEQKLIWNRGRGGTEVLADKPFDFENPAWQQHGQ